MANVYPLQTRSVDPYASYNSNVVNRLTRMISNHTNCLFSTHAIEVNIDSTAQCAVQVSTGQCFKDDVLLEVTESHIVDFTNQNYYVDITGGFFNEAGYYYVVLDYEYVKAKPAPQASLKIIPPSKRLTHLTSRHLFLKCVKLTGTGPLYTVESVHDWDPEYPENCRTYSPLFAGVENELPTFDRELHEGKIIYVRTTGYLYWGSNGVWETFSAIRDSVTTLGCEAGQLGYFGSDGTSSIVIPAIATASETLANCIVMDVGLGGTPNGQVRLYGRTDNVLVESGRSIEVGERVYLSSSEAGKITDLAPPNFPQFLGRAVSSSSGGRVSIWFQPGSESSSGDSGWASKYDNYQDLLQASVFLKCTVDTFANFEYTDIGKTTCDLETSNYSMVGQAGEEFVSKNLVDPGFDATNIEKCQISSEVTNPENLQWYVTNNGSNDYEWEETTNHTVHTFSTHKLPIDSTAVHNFTIGETIVGESSGLVAVVNAIYTGYLLIRDITGGVSFIVGETITGAISSETAVITSAQIERNVNTDVRVKCVFSGDGTISDYGLLYEQWEWVAASVSNLSQISNENGTTAIETEKIYGENQIRMKTSSIEAMRIDEEQNTRFAKGVKLGHSGLFEGGTLRYTGNDIEGFLDSTGWVSLTSGGGGTGESKWIEIPGGDIYYSAGKAGVGTVVPSSIFDVADLNASPVLTLKRIDASIGIGNEIGRLLFAGTQGGTEGNPAFSAAISAVSETNWGSQNSGALKFWTADRISGVLTERMIMTSDGNIGINVTPDSTAQLHVRGNVKVEDGTIYADSFSSNSPLVFKERDTEVARFTNNDFYVGTSTLPVHPYLPVPSYTVRNLSYISGTNLGAADIFAHARMGIIENNIDTSVLGITIGDFSVAKAIFSGGSLYGLSGIFNWAFAMGDTGTIDDSINGLFTQTGILGNNITVPKLIGNKINVLVLGDDNSVTEYFRGLDVEFNVTGSGNTFTDGTAVHIRELPAEVLNPKGIVVCGSSSKSKIYGKLCVGTSGDFDETLTVNGGIQLGFADSTNAGTIEFDGITFRGHNGSSWKNIIPDMIIREQPSETPDGTSVVIFNIDYEPVPGTEQVFLNGSLQNAGPGNDYIISGQTITFNTPPDEGSIILVNYTVLV